MGEHNTASSMWTVSGGDYSTSLKGNDVMINTTGTYEFSLNTDMVKNWISDPSTNYGVIIMGSNEISGNNYAFFYAFLSEFDLIFLYKT